MIKIYEVMDRKDEHIYSLDQMINMYDNERKNYSYVSHRLVCPSCHKREVKILIDEDNAVITTNRMHHRRNCDYYGFKMAQNIIKREMQKPDGLVNELTEIMTDHNVSKKGLPRKSIMRPLTVDDYDVYKVFYGDVVIKTAHSKDEEKYLNFSFKAPRGSILNITIEAKNFKKLKPQIQMLNDNIDETLKVYVLGKIKQVGVYNNLIIEAPQLFVLKENLDN